ncbi:MAG: Ig-like domain-containing protein, partial [bacterium]
MRYLILFLFFLSSVVFGQITGLEGWDIYLDPGHSQKENMGVYGYSEAERNVRVGLRLRDMLLNETDIDTVYICRTNDSQSVTLTQRTTDANTKGASWYHSIHSDAGTATYNSTLLLHGGWRQNGQTVEKTQQGGKKMSDIMVDVLTRGMRTTTRGNYADRTFYQGFPDNHDNKYPYLHVNRESNMPSELSEAGFHTNSRQNQLFMNDDWKRLEARTYYWSILKLHDIPRPLVRILTGNVKDKETNIPLNGAEIKVENRTYTTDTHGSLFYKYTSDPDLLHNGFYYFEEINNDEVEVVTSAEGYYPDTLTVGMIDTFFTFVDFRLISKALPTIVSTYPSNGDTGVSVLDDIVIRFNRPMTPDSIASNIIIEPSIVGGFRWSDINRELKIIPEQLEFKTNYTITIPGTITDNYGHQLDGNSDGVSGDDFVFNFTTGFDNVPPNLVKIYPPTSSTNIERQPIISFEYDEELSEESISDEIFILERFADGTHVNGILKHYVINDRSVLNFFPESKLHASEIYVSRVNKGLKDLLGNEITITQSKSFKTGVNDITITMIDNFENSVTTNWWPPDQSGTKAGFDPPTARLINNEYKNLLSNSTTSMEIYYDWDLSSSEWIIREYLSGGIPRTVFFNTDYILQIYIFGDGSGNQFRFAIDEGSSSTNLPNHEVSQWYTINWIGWRLVDWDLSDPNSVGSWIGNGILDGAIYRFDSIQLTHLPEGNETGSLYFDDLRLVKVEALGIDDESRQIAGQYTLHPNYPNPFNPSTTISFTLPAASSVRLDIYNVRGEKVQTLVNDYYNAGYWTEVWDGKN